MISSNESRDPRRRRTSFPSCTESFLLSRECPHFKHVFFSCVDGKMLSFVSGFILISNVLRPPLLAPLSACLSLVCFSVLVCFFVELESRFKTPVEDDQDSRWPA